MELKLLSYILWKYIVFTKKFRYICRVALEKLPLSEMFKLKSPAFDCEVIYYPRADNKLFMTDLF